MAVGRFLLLVSARLSASAAAANEGTPSVSMGSGVHAAARLEVKGATRLNTRADIEQKPTAYTKISLPIIGENKKLKLLTWARKLVG